MQFCKLWQYRKADSSVGGPHTWNSLQHTRETGDVIDKKKFCNHISAKNPFFVYCVANYYWETDMFFLVLLVLRVGICSSDFCANRLFKKKTYQKLNFLAIFL